MQGDPTKPTLAAPGSDEKLKVLTARWDAGVPLWVEGDNQSREQPVDDFGAGVFEGEEP